MDISFKGIEFSEKTLICAICNKLLKEPKLLPCLHSICSSCTCSKFNGHRKSIHCPICNEDCAVSDFESLPLNYWLKNEIATINITKCSEGKLCSFCEFLDERNEAIAKCLTCGDLLCQKCWNYRHTFTTQTRDHKVVSTEDIKSGKYYEEIRSQQNILCSDHKREFFRYYCNTCCTPVCQDCMVLQHAKHDFITPKEARTQTEKDLESRISEVNKELFSLKTQYSEMSKASKEIRENESTLRIRIETTCNSMINKITAQRRSLEGELTQSLRPSKTIIERESENIANKANSLENTVKFCKNILKYGTDFEILLLQREIKDRLSKISFTEKYPPVPDFMNMIPNLVASWTEPKLELVYETKLSKEKLDFTDTDSESAKVGRNNEIMNISKVANISFNETSDKGTQCDLLQTTMEGNFIECTFLKCRSLLVHNNYLIPKLTSIAWIDGESFVAVDQHNGTIQTCPLSARSGKVGLLQYCVAVTVTSWCIAVKTSSSSIELLDHNLSYKYTIASASASVVSACSPCSQFLAWISRSVITIVKTEKEHIKCMKFTDKHGNSLTLGQPRFACLLSNGKFAISDWEKDFVYLFSETGQVFREEFCYPGSITSDKNDHVYIADFYEHIINVVNFEGSMRRTIHLFPHLSHPRSISVNMDNKLAVAFENQVALFQLKIINSHQEEQTENKQSN